MRRFIVAAGCLLPGLAMPAADETPQAHVHAMSHAVMPFDVAKAWHIFRMTESGGTQKVVIRDPAFGDQVAPIRRHLQAEAARFQAGDFADPAQLHGAGMPGLAEMRASAARIRVVYRDLPDGGQIEFGASDVAALTAIHRWFGAQLSEHGPDAKAE